MVIVCALLLQPVSGKVSHTAAISKAECEYRKYELHTLSPVEQAYLDTIKQLNKEAKNKSKTQSTSFISFSGLCFPKKMIRLAPARAITAIDKPSNLPKKKAKTTKTKTIIEEIKIAKGYCFLGFSISAA